VELAGFKLRALPGGARSPDTPAAARGPGRRLRPQWGLAGNFNVKVKLSAQARVSFNLTAPRPPGWRPLAHASGPALSRGPWALQVRCTPGQGCDTVAPTCSPDKTVACTGRHSDYQVAAAQSLAPAYISSISPLYFSSTNERLSLSVAVSSPPCARVRVRALSVSDHCERARARSCV
jgi:hypothetical protein